MTTKLIIIIAIVFIDVIFIIICIVKDNLEGIKKMNEQIKRMFDERYQALASLNKERIIEYVKKYYGIIPKSEEKLDIWAHKARSSLFNLNAEERRKSHNWLKERGYKSFFTE